MNDSSLRLEQFDIKNIHGDTIRTDVRFTENKEKHPVIIICHSFMAFKNWGFFPYLASQLALNGYVSVIFNFSLNGVSGDGNRITDFERFSRNTFSRELEDIAAIVDACTSESLIKTVGNIDRIALMGHSRGGGIAIVHAASDSRIKALATYSSISTFDRWREHQKNDWRTNGFLPLSRDTAASPLRLGRELLRDYEEHSERLNILQAASQITCPWLIVHGKADVTVSSKEAEALFAASKNGIGELELVEHAGHLFNAASPGEDGYKNLNHVIEKTIQFFKRTLQE